MMGYFTESLLILFCVGTDLVVHTVRPHIYEFQSVTAQEGATAELVCRSRGDPIPQLHFSKFGDDTILNPGGNVSRFCYCYYLISQSCLLQAMLALGTKRKRRETKNNGYL